MSDDKYRPETEHPPFAWVIEHKDSPAGEPNYFSLGTEPGSMTPATPYWSPKYEDAVQFARRKDALDFKHAYLRNENHIVAEHGWLAQPPPATAQSQQWRELANKVLARHKDCPPEVECDGEQVATMLIAAADAYDQQAEQIKTLVSEDDPLIKASLREAIRSELIVQQGEDNAALRELLATARHPIQFAADQCECTDHEDCGSRTARELVAAIDAALKDKPHE